MNDVRTSKDAAHLTSSMLPHFRAWAPRITRDYKMTAVADVDDVVSLCAETTFRLLTDKRPVAHVDNWYSYVYGSCRHQVLAHFESSAVTAMSGMTEMMRRRRRSAQDRHDDLPAVDVDHEWLVASLLEHDEPTLEPHDFVLSEVEGRELVQMVIEACYDRDEQLGRAADAWIGDLYSEPPVINSGANVGRAIGVGNPRALALISRIRKIATQVCQDEYGLAGLF